MESIGVATAVDVVVSRGFGYYWMLLKPYVLFIEILIFLYLVYRFYQERKL